MSTQRPKRWATASHKCDGQRETPGSALRSAAGSGSTAGSTIAPRLDDASRVAYVDVFADEQGVTCARFLRDAGAFFARLGVRIERVMTDNARNTTVSHAFQGALDELGARHLRTQPFRPQTNGKSEAV